VFGGRGHSERPSVQYPVKYLSNGHLQFPLRLRPVTVTRQSEEALTLSWIGTVFRLWAKTGE